MSWKEKRLITILSIILSVLCAAVLLVLSVRYRAAQAAKAEDNQTSASDIAQAAQSDYIALSYNNGTTSLSFALNEEGAWYWESEPDFPLNDETVQSILALLQELNRTLGVTVVIITHEMKVVEQICGRVAILAESHVVEEGKVSEVFRHPKTAAARQLLMPGSETARETLAQGRAYRITFDGSTAEQPVVSGMVLSCGEPVNILFADMKNIEGKTYGQMLLQLPENEGAAARMLAYLESQRITYTEEEVK